MRISTILALAVGCAMLSARSAASAAPNPTVVAALDAIQKQADDVATGHVRGKKSLRAAADVIAKQWLVAEPIVVKNPNVIVETKIANSAIRQYESQWKVPAKAKAAAKNVSTAVVSLRTDLIPPPTSPPTAPPNAEPANEGTPVPVPTDSPSVPPSAAPST